MARILTILTSHTTLGETGRATGYYFDEMATPYWMLVEAGHDVDIASIAGGAAIHDPSSVEDDPADRPASVARFFGDPGAMAKLAHTRAVSDVQATDYDAVLLPGGHGTMYDFPESADLAALVSNIWARGGVVAALCHGPAGLLNATKPDGRPLVEGLRVNAFTDAEEAAAGLTDTMPFLLETRLRSQGARFESRDNFQLHAVSDDRLVTGQNPASAMAVADLLLEALPTVASAAVA